MNRILLAGGGILVGISSVLASCRPAPSLPAVRGVILISLDTLRADHLGAYGYDRETSPYLDALARRGVLFEHAYAHYPNTLASHMSMLTGLLPPEHATYGPDGVLSADIPILAELLAAAGIRTGGFTEGGFVRGEFGFARGFQRFVDDARPVRRGHGRTDSALETTLRRGVEFLSSLAEDERFFLFLHTYAPHAPYDPPSPYRRLFGADAPPAGAPPPTTEVLNLHNGELPELAAGTVAWYAALYDATIRYVDDRLRAFIDRLEREDRLADTVVIVTSDHGEEFLEHGLLSHRQLAEETLHVPLIVLAPDRVPGTGRRERGLVGLADLAPTVLDLFHLKVPRSMSGASLEPLLAGASPSSAPRAHYAEFHRGNARSVHRQEGGELWQLVWRRFADDEKHGRRARFDLPTRSRELRLRALLRRRQVEVRVDGRRLLRGALGTAGRTLRLPPASGRRFRVEVTSDTCTWTGGRRGEGRCLALELAAGDSTALERRELYRLSSDPLAQRDLSADDRERLEALDRRLRRMRFKARAPAGTLKENRERSQELRALGYLD